MASPRGKRLRKTPVPGLAERLRRARTEKGLTQEDAAEAVGVNVKTVYFYESGQVEPTEPTLNSLAMVYEKSPAWLLEGDGDEVTRWLDNLRDRASKLPSEYRDALDAVLTAMEKTAGLTK